MDFDALLNDFLLVKDIDDSQKRGFAFEKFLNMLFEAFGLNPRKPFKLVGEQIDGSLELDGEIYLIEAKWQKTPIGQSNLLAFTGKIEGKSKWTRGIVISHNGFSKDGIEAFGRGRSTNLITVDGADLYALLQGKLSFADVVKKKVRWAAETGEVAKSVFELVN